MGNDYFYEEQSDQFTFYRVPKVLVAEKRYSSMPSDAKLLYGLLLDRMSLSAKNSWLDGQGRIFIYYKIRRMISMVCGMNIAPCYFARWKEVTMD